MGLFLLRIFAVCSAPKKTHMVTDYKPMSYCPMCPLFTYNLLTVLMYFYFHLLFKALKISNCKKN